jgi:hypothetical protein
VKLEADESFSIEFPSARSLSGWLSKCKKLFTHRESSEPEDDFGGDGGLPPVPIGSSSFSEKLLIALDFGCVVF